MEERVKWWYWNLKRLHRLWVKPEQSVVDLCRIVGVGWLWRHGAKREHRIYPWSNRREWYCPDICIPGKGLIVEADGWSHSNSMAQRRDYIRDERLRELGWRIIRVTTTQMQNDPRGTRRRVRRFLR